MELVSFAASSFFDRATSREHLQVKKMGQRSPHFEMSAAEAKNKFLDSLSQNVSHPMSHLDTSLSSHSFVKRPAGFPPLATLLEHKVA